MFSKRQSVVRITFSDQTSFIISFTGKKKTSSYNEENNIYQKQKLQQDV